MKSFRQAKCNGWVHSSLMSTSLPAHELGMVRIARCGNALAAPAMPTPQRRSSWSCAEDCKVAVQEQFCLECSGRGRCVDSECICDAGRRRQVLHFV